MPSNIKINDVKSLRFRCRYDEYYDFMLYRGECYGDGYFGNCLAADIDATGLPLGQIRRNEPEDGAKYSINGGEVYSKTTWADAINNDTKMNDIGLTGIDNGFITYRKDRISNIDFFNIYTGTTYTLQAEDLRFFMSPVSGNTRMYKYPMEVNQDEKGKYFSMKGGFYQGFYKLHEMDYQTLPYFIEDEWNMSFQLRRRSDYQVEAQTLNNLHPENNGIFFYMGTRSENKFWDLYNQVNDKSEFLIPSAVSDDYFEDWDLQAHSDEYLKYLADEVSAYYADSYMEPEAVKDTGYAWDPEYWDHDIELSKIDVLTSLGYELDKKGYYELHTNNKFLFFNRTCTGFTVNNWDSSENDYTYNSCKNEITPNENPTTPEILLTGRTSSCKENKFITYNRTCTGKTVNNVHKGCFVVTGKTGSGYYEYEMDEYSPYDIYKDIKNNSFALRIDENGAIGYKYGMLDCDEPIHHYKVNEEYSKTNMVPFDQWVDVHVKFKILNPTYKDCIKIVDGVKTVQKVPTHIGERKMRIYIYVNGYLIFISKELPEFKFRGLDDVYQKQEGVPFNISLGGGTQGLLETISKDYYRIPEYRLPIETNFAGTFLGDIRYFRFYDCFMDLPTIRAIR